MSVCLIHLLFLIHIINLSINTSFLHLFHQGSLNVYRFCDNVWTFVLNNVEFKDLPDTVNVDKVKVVACDGRGMS